MAQRGKLSDAWGKYVGDVENPRAGRRVRFRKSDKPVPYDPMCDYIEDAEWWIARSDKSINQIFRAFEQGNMAICLYERTGAIIHLGRRDGQHIIAIQLVLTGKDWDIDICLSEAGIYIDEIWDGQDVEVDTL